MLPVRFQWEHRAGLTLVGDAAHFMTPFGGEGVDLALEDTWKLGQAIKDSRANPNTVLDRVVRRYEAKMFKRAHRAQEMTFKMMKAMYFTRGAPRRGIESWMIARTGYDISPALAGLCYPFLVVSVYSAYFWIKLFI